MGIKYLHLSCAVNGRRRFEVLDMHIEHWIIILSLEVWNNVHSDIHHSIVIADNHCLQNRGKIIIMANDFFLKKIKNIRKKNNVIICLESYTQNRSTWIAHITGNVVYEKDKIRSQSFSVYLPRYH